MSIKVTNNFNARLVTHKVRAAIGLFADTAAKKMEEDSKNKAPWTDRTTNARNSIQGNFEWVGNRAVIRLSGSMDYSEHLELAHEKKYAILYPTIKKFTPEVVRGYRKLVSD